MNFERILHETSHGMSEMAAKHPNDMISNALASLSDRLVRAKGVRDLMGLTNTDKQLIAYYHSNKGKI